MQAAMVFGRIYTSKAAKGLNKFIYCIAKIWSWLYRQVAIYFIIFCLDIETMERFNQPPGNPNFSPYHHSQRPSFANQYRNNLSPQHNPHFGNRRNQVSFCLFKLNFL